MTTSRRKVKTRRQLITEEFAADIDAAIHRALNGQRVEDIDHDKLVRTLTFALARFLCPLDPPDRFSVYCDLEELARLMSGVDDGVAEDVGELLAGYLDKASPEGNA